MARVAATPGAGSSRADGGRCGRRDHRLQSFTVSGYVPKARRRLPQGAAGRQAGNPRRSPGTGASNAGHLLWSGILHPEAARRTGRRLPEPDSFSGWGIRTLARGQVPYHLLSYHRGGLWPHDNAVIALGPARAGLAAEARQLAAALVEAARHHRWRC